MRSYAASVLTCAAALVCCSKDASSPAGPTPADDGGPDAPSRPADPARDGGTDVDAEAPRFVPEHFDVNHVLSTGQSLSVGAKGTPVLSKTQPFDNLALDTGVLPSTQAATSFVPLVEASVETMSSALANLVTDVAQSEVLVGLPPPNDTHRLLVSCNGVGGTAYSGLKKGTASYALALKQVTAAKEIATAAGQSYVVRVITNVHGESDHVGGNTAYDADLAQWQSDLETDVRAITGQTLPIPMLHTQMSSWTKYGQTQSTIPEQQLEASIASDGKVVMVGPKYAIEYDADGVHLTPAGYRHMGEYYAKAYRRIVLEGKRWEPLRPISATLDGSAVVVKFLVPVPPLVLDTTLVSDPGNKGFEFADGSGAPPTITDVTLVGPDTVRVQLSAAPTGANKVIRYAWTGKAGANAGATTGPRGNLRDSDASRSRNGAPLFNWAVHFRMPVQ